MNTTNVGIVTALSQGIAFALYREDGKLVEDYFISQSHYNMSSANSYNHNFNIKINSSNLIDNSKTGFFITTASFDYYKLQNSSEYIGYRGNWIKNGTHSIPNFYEQYPYEIDQSDFMYFTNSIFLRTNFAIFTIIIMSGFIISSYMYQKKVDD